MACNDPGACRSELKNKYRDKHYPIGPEGRPITPEQEFRDAFMEGFNKRYLIAGKTLE
jgi:hypothetical protein